MEDYKEKYEKLYRFVNDLYPHMSDYCKEKVDGYFPELKESDDERIRKHLIKHFGNKSKEDWNGVPVKSILAWLEKQGEQSHCNGEVNDEALQQQLQIWFDKGKCSGRDEVIFHPENFGLQKQGEQKPANNHFTPEQADVLDKHIDEFIKQKPIDKIKSKFKVGDIIRHKDSLAEYIIESISGGCYHGKGWGMSIDCDEDYELVEQKPVWSEEDEKMWSTISDLLWEGYKLSDKKVSWDKIRCWLLPKIKSLKERVQHQPKQEWSEEDEKMLQKALSTIRYALSIPIGKENDPCFAGSSTISWLKSIKDRYTWNK